MGVGKEEAKGWTLVKREKKGDEGGRGVGSK